MSDKRMRGWQKMTPEAKKKALKDPDDEHAWAYVSRTLRFDDKGEEEWMARSMRMKPSDALALMPEKGSWRDPAPLRIRMLYEKRTGAPKRDGLREPSSPNLEKKRWGDLTEAQKKVLLNDPDSPAAWKHVKRKTNLDDTEIFMARKLRFRPVDAMRMYEGDTESWKDPAALRIRRKFSWQFKDSFGCYFQSEAYKEKMEREKAIHERNKEKAKIKEAARRMKKAENKRLDQERRQKKG